MHLGTAGAGPLRNRLVTGMIIIGSLSSLAILSMLYGGGDIGPARSFDYLLGDPSARGDAQLDMVMSSLRLPRTVVGLVTGCALGLAGILLQTATRNPLAETGLLGINAGAALAVVAGITVLSLESAFAIVTSALIGAFTASAVVLVIAAGSRVQLSPLRLVLAGVALTATFRGVSSYLLLDNEATFDRYRFWVLGSLSGVTLQQVLWVALPLAAALVLTIGLARPLSALRLGDDVAAGLGHRPRRTRVLVAVAVTLFTGAAVALCGPIAFLGLLAPYVARALAPAQLTRQLLLSGAAGAAIMLTADIFARLIIRPYEAPVSMLLAIVGGPMLIVIVRSRRLQTLRVPGVRA